MSAPDFQPWLNDPTRRPMDIPFYDGVERTREYWVPLWQKSKELDGERWSLERFARHCPHLEAVQEICLPYLEHENPEFRERAMEGLSRVIKEGAASDECLRVAVRAFDDPFHMVKITAHEALQNMMEKHARRQIGRKYREIWSQAAGKEVSMPVFWFWHRMLELPWYRMMTRRDRKRYRQMRSYNAGIMRRLERLTGKMLRCTLSVHPYYRNRMARKDNRLPFWPHPETAEEKKTAIQDLMRHSAKGVNVRDARKFL